MKSFQRLAIYLPSLAGGGAERGMVILANGFASRGYRVDLVLACAKGPYLADVSPLVRVLDLRCGRVITSLWPLLRYLVCEKPIALLAAMNHANLVAVIASTLTCFPIRLVLSEQVHVSSEAARDQTLIARCVHWLLPILYPKAHCIVAISQGVACDLEHFARLAAGSVRVIPNPFDLHRITKLSREPVAHPWLLPNQPPVILGMGRLVEQKNFASLIRAFALLASRRAVRLLILGEGELLSDLQAVVLSCGLSSNQVEFLGFVSNPYAYLSRASLFVLSSRWEGLSCVLIEAMACGTPVVSTDCPSGPREVLEDGDWGPLVPVGDERALADAMEYQLATDPQTRPDVRRRAAMFDQERIIDAYLDALDLPPWPALPSLA